MSETLPQGWVETTIRQIALLNPKSNLEDDLEIGFTPMALVPVNFSENIQFEKRTWGNVKKGFTHFRNGDVIFAKITPCFENSKAAIVTGLPNSYGAGSTEYYVLRAITTPPSLLYYWVKSTRFLKAAESQMTGSVGQKRVPKTFIQSYPLPLPPLNEQKRIVAKLDAIIPRIDSVKARLEKIPVIIKRFRQSVLTAAVTGKLTEKWRENHTAANGHADYGIIELKCNQLIRNRAIRKVKFEETSNNGLVTGQIPKSWVFPKIGKLFKFIDYRGKTPKKNNEGKRLITAKNIGFGFLKEEPVEYISEAAYKKWMTRGFPSYLDIFFVTEGATMGFCALNTRTDEFALAQRIITLSPIGNLDTKTFFYFFLSPYFQTLINENSTGSAAVGIKGAKFRNLDIPFPPLEEQKEIVRQVDRLFALADKLEAHYHKAKARIDKLSQSVLAKAFRGELVPQDPNDEPAEKLLERIMGEKAKMMDSGRQKAKSINRRTKA